MIGRVPGEAPFAECPRDHSAGRLPARRRVWGRFGCDRGGPGRRHEAGEHRQDASAGGACGRWMRGETDGRSRAGERRAGVRTKQPGPWPASAAAGAQREEFTRPMGGSLSSLRHSSTRRAVHV